MAFPHNVNSWWLGVGLSWSGPGLLGDAGRAESTPPRHFYLPRFQSDWKDGSESHLSDPITSLDHEISPAEVVNNHFHLLAIEVVDSAEVRQYPSTGQTASSTNEGLPAFFELHTPAERHHHGSSVGDDQSDRGS